MDFRDKQGTSTSLLLSSPQKMLLPLYTYICKHSPREQPAETFTMRRDMNTKPLTVERGLYNALCTYASLRNNRMEYFLELNTTFTEFQVSSPLPKSAKSHRQLCMKMVHMWRAFSGTAHGCVWPFALEKRSGGSLIAVPKPRYEARCRPGICSWCISGMMSLTAVQSRTQQG